MVLSRSTKIFILLGISGSFFVVELAVGHIVGSLALIADAYHMLNDTISLIIALYAIRLSKRSSNAKYTYGWHRAEVISALVNGVFLLALCFSIFLEALERFARPQEIQDPRLVVIVGVVGLCSNLFGLVLFHEHGHNHGHSSTHGGAHTAAHDHSSSSSVVLDSDASVRRSGTTHPVYGLSARIRFAFNQAAQGVFAVFVSTDNEASVNNEHLEEDDIIFIGPSMALASQELRSNEAPTPAPHPHPHKNTAEGSLNVRSIILHIAGDALGSVGVILSGLIIWFAQSPARYCADPVLSIVITILIMCSAVPLVRSAGFILLQGVPSSISLSEVRTNIAQVHGIDSVHELHVWQLSETRFVASVHIKVSSARPYMDVVRDVKSVLHQCGIHSGTVQPEFSGDGSDTKCEITCPPNTCGIKEACCPLPPVKEDGGAAA